MKPLSANPLSIPGSGIREIMNAALQMENVLHVEVGEPDFPTPAHIVAAGQQALAEGYTRYTANAGLPGLRRALAEKVRRLNGLEVGPEQVVVTHGAVSGLMAAMTALVEPGDEVLLPDPGWPNYEMMVRLVGGTVVRYPLNAAAGFLPNVATMAGLITPRTKAILVNSPNNPTGAVFPGELVEAILRLARQHDLWVISDEVYEQILFEGEHVSPARFDPDGRVISVYSFSKTYSMTGWRVGYTVIPAPVFPVINKLQEAFISCTNAGGQRAAEAALLGPQDCVEEMRLAYKRRRDLVVSRLQEYGMFTYAPQGAFYVMVKVGAPDTYAFAKRLLHQERVAVAPGETFGPTGRGFIRIALCAADATIETALERIARVVRSDHESGR